MDTESLQTYLFLIINNNKRSNTMIKSEEQVYIETTSLSIQTTLSIIELLLTKAKESLDDCNDYWDGVVGDLSAPEYASIHSEIYTLEFLHRIISSGERRKEDKVRANGKRCRRSKDLLKLANTRKKY